MGARRGWVVLGAAAWFAACKGPDLGDFCDKRESCNGGNAKDKAACVDELKTSQAEASDIGCRKEFDDLTSCLDDAGTCISQSIPAPCVSSADCAQFGNAVCAGGQCAFRRFGVDPKNSACD